MQGGLDSCLTVGAMTTDACFAYVILPGCLSNVALDAHACFSMLYLLYRFSVFCESAHCKVPSEMEGLMAVHGRGYVR